MATWGMNDTITAIFVLVDDVLKGMRGENCEDIRRQMSDAEVLTTALAGALYFGGNMERARACLCMNGMVPRMLKKSRFNRRLHALGGFLEALFFHFGMGLKELTAHSRFLVDSFPVPICDNYRIPRARIVHDEAFRGKIASKRRYFYGVKVQVVTTEEGFPVEFAILPGSAADVHGYDVLPLALPKGSELYGDAAYCSYWREDTLIELDQLAPQICYARSAKQRRQSPEKEGFKKLTRKYIESVFSAITNLFPRHIHATTFRGFQLKLCLFLSAFTFEKALSR